MARCRTMDGVVVEDISTRKTRRGKIVRTVRERYLRDDVLCRSERCLSCLDRSRTIDTADGSSVGTRGNILLGGAGTDDTAQIVYTVLDPEVVQVYIDLLVSVTEFRNIIFPQTVFDNYSTSGDNDAVAHLHSHSRFTNKLNEFLSDAVRQSIVFPNEHFVSTYVHRQTGETRTARAGRAVCAVASWYVDHLQGCADVVLVSNLESTRDLATDLGVKAMSLTEYIRSCLFADQSATKVEQAMEQYHSIKQSIRSLIDAQQSEQDDSVDGDDIAETANRGVGGRSLFSQHKGADALLAGIKSGLFMRGKIAVNPHVTDEAFVRVSEGVGIGLSGAEVFIPNRYARNRAVHNDVVAVRILPKEKWMIPRSRTQFESSEGGGGGGKIAGSDSGGAFVMPTGRIVGIMQRNWRPYVATLQLEQSRETGSGGDGGSAGEKGGKTRHQVDGVGQATSHMRNVLVVPMDKKIPKIRIGTRQAVQLSNARIVVTLDSWDTDSHYPRGHYVRNLGEIGERETAIGAILVENEVRTEPFGTKALACLPEHPLDPTIPWRAPQDEIDRRRDLRSAQVFSIDPPGCQDIDDALSARRVYDDTLGRYVLEVGVHIADVTHFVPHKSALDLEARDRGTSVYLADRRIDMLPTLLSERLCSLRSDEDRLAVSVLWKMDETTMEVLDEWYGRTVIRSRYEMNYAMAEAIVMDGGSHATSSSLLSKAELSKLLTEKGLDYADVRGDLLRLTAVARHFRNERMKKGALELHSLEVKFELNRENNPVAIATKDDLEVHHVVAELMILANRYVAHRIWTAYPHCSLLRHHTLPRSKALDDLMQCVSSLGFRMDVSSNKALAASLAEASARFGGNVSMVMKVLATQAMSEATYISTGEYDVEAFHHYGLAAEFYTHFTSPIRRYADIVVHRLLLSAVEPPQQEGYVADQPIDLPGEPLAAPVTVAVANPPFHDTQLRAVCSRINDRNRASKACQRDSDKLFQALYFERQPEAVLAKGIIYEWRTNGLLCLIPKYGIKGAVRLKDKNGADVIPPNIMSLSPDVYQSDLDVRAYDIDLALQRLTLKTALPSSSSSSSSSSASPSPSSTVAAPDVIVELFDHVTVRIAVRQSRSHTPSLVLELVHFGHDPYSKHESSAPSAAKSKVNDRRTRHSHSKDSSVPAKDDTSGKEGVVRILPRRNELVGRDVDNNAEMFRVLSLGRTTGVPSKEERVYKQSRRSAYEMMDAFRGMSLQNCVIDENLDLALYATADGGRVRTSPVAAAGVNDADDDDDDDGVDDTSCQLLPAMPPGSTARLTEFCRVHPSLSSVLRTHGAILSTKKPAKEAKGQGAEASGGRSSGGGQGAESEDDAPLDEATLKRRLRSANKRLRQARQLQERAAAAAAASSGDKTSLTAEQLEKVGRIDDFASEVGRLEELLQEQCKL
eukprot:TRINITY_DN1239_c0_g1_i1.p1 TRINITY_DN1239_c0_g1~~TRINITY_DN1239_c0_g1_i1.p1  ORF type:complete len:1420 (+),score=301.75 TRINITY_DN1239_c0_g1_i1:275-4534(+)